MGKHCLYRHYNQAGDLLYVGISTNHRRRSQQHQCGSEWYADVSKITIEWFDDKHSARQAEADAIFNEQPIYNKAHKYGSNSKACVVSMNESQSRLLNEAASRTGLDLEQYLRFCALRAAANWPD
jgi:predicted GIY-YIG superfamily endonuclease